MTVDRYTKAVLTVIAICLVWLSLGGPALLPTATAQAVDPRGLNSVYLAGWVDGSGTVRTLTPPSEASGLPVVSRGASSRCCGPTSAANCATNCCISRSGVGSVSGYRQGPT
jgi:hypothetical protein